MTSVVRMIYNYDDGDDNENDDDEYQGYNYDTWKGETPYKEGEHNDVGEDGSEVGNLKMVNGHGGENDDGDGDDDNHGVMTVGMMI